MVAEATSQEWIEFPGDRYVSANRARINGSMFSLASAAKMDVETFNKEAARYEVRIEAEDSMVDRFVKYHVFLSRRDNDGSSITNNPEYVANALHAAAKKQAEPFKSFYLMLTHDAVDFVGEVLAFRERIATGDNKSKYVAERNVFNKDGILVSMDNIMVAPEGWTRVLGVDGYPIETSKAQGTITSIGRPGLDENNISGYWYVGEDPVGQERIALRGPLWDGGGLLYARVGGGRSCSGGGVGALRSRNAVPADYQLNINNLKVEVGKFRNRLKDANKILKNLT